MKNNLLTDLRKLRKKIDSYKAKFGDNDIRTSFLGGYFQILRTFYCSYYHLESKDILEKYSEIYEKDNIREKDLALHLQSHRQLLNSYLIINCWSNFELFITLCCATVLPEPALKELLEGDYRGILRILNGSRLTERSSNKLKSRIKFHVAHAPIVYKYGKLLKLIHPYPEIRNKKNDRDFLEFYGRLRNCIHSNYIFFGASDKEYTYDNEKFSFRNGSVIDHNPSDEGSIYRLTSNLKEIGCVIIDNLDYESEIFDPSVELIKK